MSFTNSDPRKLRQQIIPSDIHFIFVYTLDFIQSNSTSFPQILLVRNQRIQIMSYNHHRAENLLCGYNNSYFKLITTLNYQRNFCYNKTMKSILRFEWLNNLKNVNDISIVLGS